VDTFFAAMRSNFFDSSRPYYSSGRNVLVSIAATALIIVLFCDQFYGFKMYVLAFQDETKTVRDAFVPIPGEAVENHCSS
jgi:hypothetical protein